MSPYESDMIDASGKLTKKYPHNSLKGDVPLSPTRSQLNDTGAESVHLKAHDTK